MPYVTSFMVECLVINVFIVFVNLFTSDDDNTLLVNIFFIDFKINADCTSSSTLYSDDFLVSGRFLCTITADPLICSRL